MRKRNKKHWVERLPSLACGGIARPGSAKDTCGLLWVHCGASVYRDLATANPDWYCVRCAKAARLALAAESAPKPSDIVWSKPRPISEAPTDGTSVLAHWSVGNFPRLRGCRWEVARVGSGLAWFNEHDEPLSAPDYFLPLPPEVL